MLCTGCNNYIEESAKFCPICGKNLSESGTLESYVSEQQRKEQIIEDLEEKFLKRRERLYGALVIGQLFFGIILDLFLYLKQNVILIALLIHLYINI